MVKGTLNTRIKCQESLDKIVCKVQGIALNRASVKFVNFDSTRNMNKHVNATDVITVHTEKKIIRKMRKCVPPGSDTVSVVSESEENVYRLYFHKGTRLEICDSFPFST